jgi:hypothetical protein
MIRPNVLRPIPFDHVVQSPPGGLDADLVQAARLATVSAHDLRPPGSELAAMDVANKMMDV